MTGPHLCQSLESTNEIFNRLDDASEFVYDSETDGLDQQRCNIVGHVFTFGPAPQDTYYVPVRHGGGGNIIEYSPDLGTNFRIFDHPFEQRLKRIAEERRNLRWIGHNLLFDNMMMWRHRINNVGLMEDTQVNAALLNEFQNGYDLENCCLAAKTTPKKGEELYRHLANLFGGEPGRAQMGQFWRLAGNDPLGFDYAAGDGTSTWDLKDAQRVEIQRQELSNAWEMERAITRVVFRLKRRGIRIDQERLQQVIDEVDAKISKAREVVPDDFAPRSPIYMKKFFSDRGITQWPLTELGQKQLAKGKPFYDCNASFSEAWLKTHDIGQQILVIKKYEHLKNSFMIPLQTRHVWADGRVHPTFHQSRADEFGTVTYRFSCSDPNLQQNHKRNKELGLLSRSYFVADDGEEWLDADLSQCEPRILTHYSRAKVLLAGYLSVPFVDSHTAVSIAAGFTHDPYDPECAHCKNGRENGKRLNQTLITGGGLRRIQELLGEEEGAKVYKDYFRALPEIKKLQKDASKRMTARGYVKALLGHRKRLESRDKAYKAVNALLQVGNAEIIKDSMVRIDQFLEETGDEVKMLNTVHDALSWSVPPTPEHRNIALECLRIMTDFGPGRRVEMAVPMAADYAFGKTWAEATYAKNREVIGDRVGPVEPFYLRRAA